jgi:hypothetical protein
MNLQDTLTANLALPRAPLAGVGWADLAERRIPVPVSWADADADAAWAVGILADYGIGPADHCLLVAAGSEYWPLPVETAVTRLGGFIGNIGTAAYEDRRLSVYLRFLLPKVIVGLTEALAEKIAGSDELTALTAKVPHVLALPAAAPVLASLGIAAKPMSPVGPALALPCARGEGAHVDGSQFAVEQGGGDRELRVTTAAGRELRLADAAVSTPGALLAACECGRPGPVLDLR